MTESNVPFRIRRALPGSNIDRRSLESLKKKSLATNRREFRIPKSQTPRSKQTSITKSQNRSRAAPLDIEDWNLLGIWSLGFGASSLAEASS
jgi:hypothetical protein